MDGGGGGSNAAGSLLMAFGDNNPSSMRMMMFPPSSSSPPCQNINGSGGALFYHNLHHHHHQDPQGTTRHGSTDISAGATPTVIMKNNTHTNTAAGCYFLDENSNNNNVNDDGNLSWSVKAKIMSHPHYPRLLSAYLSCQKIGAPPEVVARLEEACSASVATMARATAGASSSGGGGGGMIIGQDPALDQFMEAYCEMLTKYEQELSKPFKEAMIFLSRIESQFKTLSIASQDPACGEVMDRNGSSEEEFDVNNNLIDPQAEDRELKGQLLRKYSGYLGSLKQEFMKKRKKGKLPKEARQQLLDWWSRHYKWPYPSEAQKLALAESTGLDQKQINNWFINQRKRHWKPSEDMQFVVMDAAHPHYFLDNVMGNPYPMDISPALL